MSRNRRLINRSQRVVYLYSGLGKDAVAEVERPSSPIDQAASTPTTPLEISAPRR